MRICLVVHGFPPIERTGVENYTLGLCRALVRAGHRVEVFVPRRDPSLADLALRREERGGFAVNWITDNHAPGSASDALLVPQLKGAFAAFLDRERPEVVHFQHLIKLGLELVEVARERGLPTIYTAHDYYPICHRYTLLRPDLSRCEVRGDVEACARCDMAVSLVNAQPDVGDYHSGVMSTQVSPEVWGRLQGILAGRLEEQGISQEAFEPVLRTRKELDSRRAGAYRGFDLILAPSLHLLEELVRGGVERERIQHQPYGFDNDDLAGMPPVRSDPSRRVRFAFLGGMSKHKGVHVVLDAYRSLRDRADLALWGDSSDRPYVRMLRERCGEVGAQMRGPYERSDLPQILPDVDALIVSSTWVENYPLVIHEGFSAGRPVLGSRLGAIPESIREGVDGLLFTPGDHEDLARVMQRCVEEPDLLSSLARGIGAVKTMDEEARLLVERYERLVEGSRSQRIMEALPQSLEVPLTRFDELSALPARELFVRVLAGFEELRESWVEGLGEASPLELLAMGLSEGSEAQDRLREARNEIAWLRTKKDELDEGREELMTLFEDLDRLLVDTRSGTQEQAERLESSVRNERQKEAEVREAHERLRELEGVVGKKDTHLEDVEGQLREAGRYIQQKDQEVRSLEEGLHKANEYVRLKEAELQRLVDDGRRREEELYRVGARTKEQDQELQQTAVRLRLHEEQLLEAVRLQEVREAELMQAVEGQKSTEEELRRVSESKRARELELREVQERKLALTGGTRDVAQVGLLAIRAQERVLNHALRPWLARLHELNAPDAPFEPPHEGAGFMELIRASSQVREGLMAVAEELEWRRRVMGRMADVVRVPLSLLLGRERVKRLTSRRRSKPESGARQ